MADEFSIGNIQVAHKRNLLIVDQAELSLEPRVMDVLCYLSQFAPDVVGRDDLIENIWKVEYGGDESLTRAISILRKTFKSAGVNEVMIETIPKRGYRLTASPRAAVVTNNINVLVTETPNPTSKLQSKMLAKVVLWTLTAAALTFGLVYFFQGLTNSATKANAEQDINAMAEVSIDVCNGKENVKSVDLITGITCWDLDSNALSDSDKTRYIDMARTKDPSTYMEGFDQLETHAITFNDWQLLAELSFNKDTNRSIKAIREALLLDPDHFFMQSLLSQAYAVTGRGIEARTSIKNLKSIAKTDEEKNVAAYTFVNIATTLQDSELLKEARSELNDILVETQATLSAELKTKSVSDKEIMFHPYWILAAGYQALATADKELRDIDASLKSLDQSDKFFKLLAPIAKGDAEFAPYYRLVVNNGLRATAFKEEANYEGALKAHQENILLYFDLRDIDYKSVGIRFPDTWFEMGELYLLKKDNENAKLMFENSEQEYQSLLDKNSNHSQALAGLEKSQAKLTEIKKKF